MNINDSLNQPAAARGYQSIFWNISIFDKYYFDAIFGSFYFPDGSRPDYNSLRKLQYFFMEWFTEERTKSLLTFPVVTESSLNNEDGTPKDLEFAEKMAEFRANGLSFFSYNDTNASALSSCCLEGSEKLKFTINGKTVEKSIKDFVQSYISGEDSEIKLDEDIYVESFNTKTKEKEQSRVSGVLSKHYYGKLYKFVVNDNIITVTPDHPFTVFDRKTNNLVTIDAKTVYDNMNRYLIPCDIDGIKFINIDSAEEKETSSTTVYDIEVADTSHFIANNIVTHNCRLRNAIEKDDEDNEFAYTLGGVGVATGSTSVMTLNFNRVAQKAIRRYLKNQDPDKPLTKGYIHSFINNNYVQAEVLFFNKVEELVKKIHKYQFAHRQIVEDYIKSGMLPAYTAGYITTNKQFCTIGISGLNECAEFMGYKVANNSDYKDFIARLLGILTRLNKEARKIYKIKFNSEFIPGENLGIKNAKWDKKDGLEVPRDCYNSYFYLSESTDTSIPDKFQMHGDPIASHIDGGSAAHINLSQLPDKEFFLWLRNLAGKYGCNYWTTNVLETMCEDCGHNDFRTLDECPVCGSKHVSYASRIIGLTR